MFAKKPPPVQKNKPPRQGLPAWLWMIIGSLLTLAIGLFFYLWNPLKSDSVAKDPEVQLEAGDTETGSTTTNDKQDSSNYEFYDLLPEQEVTPIPDTAITTGDKPKENVDVTIKLPTEDFDNDATYSQGGEIQNPQVALPAPVEDTGSDETYDGGAPADNPAHAQSSQSQPKTITNVDGSAVISSDPIADTIKNINETSYILQINSFTSAEDADRRRAEVLLAGIDANVVKTTKSNGKTLYQVISRSYDNKTQAATAQLRLQTSGIDSLVVERKHQ